MLLDVDGARLSYRDEGSGEPLFLIAGFGAPGSFWDGMRPFLEEFRVITFDNRGVGATEWSRPFTLEDMADDVVALADHLGIDRFHAAGWSLGSQVAQILAARHGGRLKSLVLVSTYLREPPRSGYLLRTLCRMAADGVIPTEAVGVAVNAMCMPESAFDGTGAGTPRTPRLGDPRGLLAQLDVMRPEGTAEAVRSIGTPALVIHGDADIMVDLSYGVEVAEALPRGNLAVMEGDGHLMPPGRYAGVLADFVSAHIQSARARDDSADFIRLA